MNDTGNNQNIGGLRLLLRALRNRNYRLFFTGQGLSLIGTWMQSVAMSWLAYRLTNSPFYLGVVGFSLQIPIFIAAPFGGVIADKFDRKKILIVTQFFSMLQALIATALAMTGIIRPWHIIILSALLGTINGFDMPTRQAFVRNLVDNPDDLPNAIALNSLIFNGARLIGPTIAGLLIAFAGEGTCFLVNAVSFIPVLLAFAVMKIRPLEIPRHNGTLLTGLKDGFSYAFSFVPIKVILLLLVFLGLVAMPYTVVLPVFAKDVLAGDSKTYGFLMAAAGIGAITGALFLASQKNVTRFGKIILASMCIFAVAVIVFSMSRVLWFSLIMMTLIGFGLMSLIVSLNTLLQTIVDDTKRGRVMSLYLMSALGMAPFGSILAGAAAHSIGAPLTVRLAGVLCLLAAVLFSRKLPQISRLIKPVYAPKGIIPAVADAIGTVSTLSTETED
ncbi:MAG: MFS transporter [Sedimentisphaerales bacterium]|nr:MFS transporter [Sedimentisphaerales bacterium]